MGYANTIEGTQWPPEARGCPVDKSRHFADPEGNGIIIPPRTSTTYILTNYWGVRDAALEGSSAVHAGYEVPDGWTKFPLWVKESESSNLGFESETASSATFYYMDYTLDGVLLKPEAHSAKAGQYTIYRAKTSTQITAFDGNTLKGDGLVGRGRPRRRTGSLLRF